MTSRLLASLLAAALSLLAALPAAAQNALTVYGGYRGGGSFEQTVGATTTTDDIDGSGVFALSFEWAIDAARNGQVFARGQRTHLQLAPGSAQASVPIDIAYLHLGGTNFFEGHAGQGAYIAGGLGATFMSPSEGGLSSEIRPSMSLALGYEHALTPSVSLRGEVRGYATLINSSGGFFCSGGCVVSIHGDGMLQAEALLGLSMRF
ncbi:MAG: hypothetical protein ABI633_03400 [Burkholderiales bacterium]